MKSKRIKHLKLNKQTVVSLDRVILTHINGGGDDPELPITFGCPTYNCTTNPNKDTCQFTCPAIGG